MTHTEIAERLRDMTNRIGSLTAESLKELANELDPPRPLTGTVVWWKRHDYTKWNLGYVADRQYGVVPLNDEIGFDDYYLPWADVEWKPARILDDDEVAVKIPPVSEWRDAAIEVWLEWHDEIDEVCQPGISITRAEAQRMERER